MQPNVPSAVHQAFVESAIDEVIEIGNRAKRNTDEKSTHDYLAMKHTFDTLSHFLNEYKKNVHESRDGDMTPASTETMEVDGEKKIVIARCHLSSLKEVALIFHPF